MQFFPGICVSISSGLKFLECSRVPTESSVEDWLMSIVSNTDTLSTQLLSFLLHKIWSARNDLVFKNLKKRPEVIASEALDCVAEFNRFGVAKGKPGVAWEQEDMCCSDTQIVQIDAGVFTDDSAAFGCVFRKLQQGVSLAACSKELITVEPAVAEILAICWGLRLARDLKVEKVLVQSDAMMVVDCINGIQKFAVIEPIAADCRELLKSFTVSSIMFINRNCNIDAHNLVRWGKHLGSRTWLGGVPDGDPVSSVLPVSS